MYKPKPIFRHETGSSFFFASQNVFVSINTITNVSVVVKCVIIIISYFKAITVTFRFIQEYVFRFVYGTLDSSSLRLVAVYHNKEQFTYSKETADFYQ